jgi:hypothetical protein
MFTLSVLVLVLVLAAVCSPTASAAGVDSASIAAVTVRMSERFKAYKRRSPHLAHRQDFWESLVLCMLLILLWF